MKGRKGMRKNQKRLIIMKRKNTEKKRVEEKEKR